MRRPAYADRRAAGRALAEPVRALGLAGPVVLGLPRGGVPVAAEVAAALDAPLGLLLVRKIGAPGRAELAMGAVALVGGRITVHRNEDILGLLHVVDATFAAALLREQAELTRRARLWPNPDLPEFRGRPVVVVDDGLATGATMAAAVAAVRTLTPDEVVVAVPVGAAEAVAGLGRTADRVVCPLVPRGFVAVGSSYRDFRQLRDDEVAAALDGAG